MSVYTKPSDIQKVCEIGARPVAQTAGAYHDFCSIKKLGVFNSPMDRMLVLHSVTPSVKFPGARFSKAPESFRARKAIFRSSVSKNGEVYTLETSCMKGTSLHL